MPASTPTDPSPGGWTSRWRGAAARSYGLGIVGQGCNFAAMLVALALAPSAAVVSLVLTAAIASAVVQFALLGLGAHLPLVSSPRSAREALVHSWCFLALVALGLAVTGEVLLGTGVDVGASIGFSAVLVVAMALDATVVALFVRDGDAGGVARNRFRYGVINLVLTTVVAANVDWQWSLVLSGAAVYALTAAYVLCSSRYGLSHLRSLTGIASWRGFAAYARANVTHGATFLLHGLSNQVPALALPTLGGRSAAAWASMTSIVGGFGSVVLQLVVPGVDSALARRVRSGEPGGRMRIVAVGLLAGAGLASVALVVAVVGSWVLGYLAPLPEGEATTLVVALVLYWGSTITLTPLTHAMSLLGMRGTRLAWDVARGLTMVTVLALGPGGATTLVWLGVVSVAYVVVHVLLILLRWRRGVRAQVADRVRPEPGQPVGP